MDSVAQVTFSAPVWLEEDAVDLFEIDGLGAVPHGFHHRCDAEVSDASQNSFAGACDETESVIGEGIVAKCDLVELDKDELDGVVGSELLQHNRVGDAASDVVVDSQIKLENEFWLGDQDQVVVLGKVLENKSQTPQGVHLHQMRVIDDGCEHLALLVDPCSLGDEGSLTPVSEPFGLDIKRLTQNSQDGMVRMQRAIDRGRQEHLRVELLERLLDDALARAWFADEHAEASLLAMDP